MSIKQPPITASHQLVFEECESSSSDDDDTMHIDQPLDVTTTTAAAADELDKLDKNNNVVQQRRSKISGVRSLVTKDPEIINRWQANVIADYKRVHPLNPRDPAGSATLTVPASISAEVVARMKNIQQTVAMTTEAAGIVREITGTARGLFQREHPESEAGRGHNLPPAPMVKAASENQMRLDDRYEERCKSTTVATDATNNFDIKGKGKIKVNGKVKGKGKGKITTAAVSASQRTLEDFITRGGTAVRMVCDEPLPVQLAQSKLNLVSINDAHVDYVLPPEMHTTPTKINKVLSDCVNMPHMKEIGENDRLVVLQQSIIERLQGDSRAEIIGHMGAGATGVEVSELALVGMPHPTWVGKAQDRLDRNVKSGKLPLEHTKQTGSVEPILVDYPNVIAPPSSSSSSSSAPEKSSRGRRSRARKIDKIDPDIVYTSDAVNPAPDGTTVPSSINTSDGVGMNLFNTAGTRAETVGETRDFMNIARITVKQFRDILHDSVVCDMSNRMMCDLSSKISQEDRSAEIDNTTLSSVITNFLTHSGRFIARQRNLETKARIDEYLAVNNLSDVTMTESDQYALLAKREAASLEIRTDEIMSRVNAALSCALVKIDKDRADSNVDKYTSLASITNHTMAEFARTQASRSFIPTRRDKIFIRIVHAPMGVIDMPRAATHADGVVTFVSPGLKLPLQSVSHDVVSTDGSMSRPVLSVAQMESMMIKPNDLDPNVVLCCNGVNCSGNTVKHPSRFILEAMTLPFENWVENAKYILESDAEYTSRGIRSTIDPAIREKMADLVSKNVDPGSSDEIVLRTLCLKANPRGCVRCMLRDYTKAWSTVSAEPLNSFVTSTEFAQEYLHMHLDGHRPGAIVGPMWRYDERRLELIMRDNNTPAYIFSKSNFCKASV